MTAPDAAPTCRFVDPADESAWLQLWHGYCAEYAPWSSEEARRRTWYRLFDPQEQIASIVAWKAGRAIGLANCVLADSTLFPQGICILSDMWVTPQARRQGVGTALLSACVDFARQLQRPMEWATAAENTGAKRLYAKVARVAEPSVRYVV